MLLAARKQQPEAGREVVPTAGPLNDAERFAKAAELRVALRVAELKGWSETLELPSLPDAEAWKVFERMLRHPRFDGGEGTWRALPYAELHATADKELYNEEGRGWPVWKGNTFDRYRPDIAAPVYWAEPGPVLERLQRKGLGSRSVFGAFPRAVVQDPATLPPLDCRIVFRDVVRATDRRTMKACLAPPNVFAIHKAPQLVWPQGNVSDMAFVLGMLNSLPYDWLLRRRVEATMSFGILNAMPVPDAGNAAARIAALAGRLSCMDARYADFATRVGVDYGLLSEHQRADMEAEIDALVAHAYGLTADDLHVIFRDFVEAALPIAQRQRILKHFER